MLFSFIIAIFLLFAILYVQRGTYPAAALPYQCMMVFACVNKACFIFLQAMGKAAASTILSMIREIVFGVGFALLLPVFFGLDGVLYSMPLSDALTFLVAVILIIGTYKELNQRS